ncbi:uncharacterized protein LOC123274251 isoform X2 [Cotesia glomerata]|uniref:uncharacterized protein LOC123274251 isoform X2 n=1 Tax=Cotesia glomerata TaxID=32391 RepID=UPI001D015608|nr:uncharacterized protein LOC123274251 isoform X2 [Cotesia glomerata]
MLVLFSNHVSSITCCYGQDNTTPSFIRSDNNDHKDRMKKGTIPGCKACTNEEMTYCKDGSVINDHCCCDSAYNEVFPFVEHTCRIGRQACKIKVDNCAEYERLRDCCCLSYLGSVWKYRAGGIDSVKPSLLITTGALLILHVCHKMYN